MFAVPDNGGARPARRRWLRGRRGARPGQAGRAARGRATKIAAFRVCQRVQFVEHDAGQRGEEFRRVGAGEQQRQLFRRRHQDRGWRVALAQAAVLRRVAGAGFDGDAEAHFGEQDFEVALDVDGERLQRRDVERVQRGLRWRIFCEIDKARQKSPPASCGAGGRDQQRGFVGAGEIEQRQLMRARAPAARFKPAREGGRECGGLKRCSGRGRAGLSWGEVSRVRGDWGRTKRRRPAAPPSTSPSGGAPSFASAARRRYLTRSIAGGTHRPSTASGAGAKSRKVTPSLPLAGAGSQFDSRALPGFSCCR